MLLAASAMAVAMKALGSQKHTAWVVMGCWGACMQSKSYLKSRGRGGGWRNVLPAASAPAVAMNALDSQKHTAKVVMGMQKLGLPGGAVLQGTRLAASALAVTITASG